MSLSAPAQQLTIQYVKRIPIKGMPEYEVIVLNDDLQNIIRHKPTNIYHCASILHAVAKDGPVQKLAYWFRLSETLELLRELDTNGENSHHCSETPKTLEELKKSLFRYISNKDMPDKYKYLRGYYCPQILVHELGGWANKRYRIKLLKYLENHYTDEDYTTLKSEKDDLQRRFDALMENMDAMRNDIHTESKRMRKELKDKTDTIRKDFDIKTEEIKAIVRSGCKTTTSAAKEIKRIASTDKHITSNYTTGLLLVLNNQSDMPFNNKPTRRLKFRAIEQGSIKGGTYKHEIETAWKIIPNSHPKDAFKIVANEMQRTGLSIPISNRSTLYWHGNTKEIRIYESKLSAIESFIDTILPGLLNGELTELNDKANVIQESAKQILKDI